MARPAGRPSTMTLSDGPWLSPAVRKRNIVQFYVGGSSRPFGLSRRTSVSHDQRGENDGRQSQWHTHFEKVPASRFGPVGPGDTKPQERRHRSRHEQIRPEVKTEQESVGMGHPMSREE